MKKLIFLMLFTLLLIGNVSSASFDNKLTYKDNNMTAVIENLWGWEFLGIKFGGKLGEATLKSHNSLTEIKEVIAGKNRVVMYYEFIDWEKYNKGLGQVYFIDMKTGEEIDKDYYFAKAIYKDTIVNDYGSDICKEVITINGTYQDCQRNIIGTHIETKIDGWEKLGTTDIPEGNNTIGLITDVLKGDYIDGVWTIAGKKISKHASWNDTFEVNLKAVWNMEMASGDAVDVFSGVHNGTASGSPIYQQTGIHNFAVDFEVSGGNDYFTIADSIDLRSGDITISAWVNIDSLGSTRRIFASGDQDVGGAYSMVQSASNKFQCVARDDPGSTLTTALGTVTITSGVWYNVVCVFNTSSKTAKVYVNGTLETTGSATTGALGLGNGGAKYIGRDGNVAIQAFDGLIDEVYLWKADKDDAFISQLYDSGVGTFFGTIPNVTLNSPANDTNQNTSELTFNCSSIGEAPLLNLSLIIDDELNTTIFNTTANQLNLELVTSLNFSEGSYNWTCNTFDNLLIEGTTELRIFSIDSIPPDVLVTSPTGDQGAFIVNRNLTLSWTVSDSNLNTCFYDYAGTNTTVTCSDNSTNLTVTDVSLTSLTFYANDSTGNLNSSSTSWGYNLIENNISFTINVSETSTQIFEINLTIIENFTSISGFLNYNGQNDTSTITCSEKNCIFSNSINIPLITSASKINSFFWDMTLINSTGSTNVLTSTNNQNVSLITLGLCNSTLTNTYLNFTFKNETTNKEIINATISSTIFYWLGDGSINRTLSFSNSTENIEYTFCFSPADKILNTDMSINYNNQESQQRTFNQRVGLSNITTNQILFLLPTSLGLFAQFQTVDSLGRSISSVQGTITRILGSSTITIASSFTDSSGFINYFLNPDVTYNAVFSKTGFIDNSFSFIPITTIRNVIMGTTVQEVNGSQISINTTYQIFPTSNSLNNNTDFTFGFNVSSNQPISLISMNITNITGGQLLFLSNAGTGFISSILNTGNNTQLIGKFIIQTGSETLILTKLWIIEQENVGDYSIFRQLTLYTEYGFSDFIRLLMVIAIIMGMLIFMSTGEITDTSESKVLVVLLLIWAFSFVGWLDNPSAISNTPISQFAKQYGIAILSTAAGIFFVLRRLF